jgi:hypothetical protein
VAPDESHGPIAFDFNNKGRMWRYFDNGIKQKISDGIRGTGPATFGNEVTVTAGRFSCKDEEFKMVNQACKTISFATLSKAVRFWKNWLNNPITKEKVYQNYLVRSERELNNINNVFKKYFDILNNLNLIFYDQTTPNEEFDAFAYVNASKSLYDIHVNCSLDNETLLDTMVHEIQHLIYYVKPLNPAKKISNIFVGKNNKPETMSNIFNFDKLEIPNIKNPLSISKNMKETAKKLNIYDSYLSSLKFDSDVEEKSDPGYVCRETEKMSNIMAMRNLFSIQPGGKITSNMLKHHDKIEKNSILLLVPVFPR